MTRHIFTTRHGGVSTGVYASLNLGINRGDEEENVRENYRRLGAMLGCSRFVFANQQHTTITECRPEQVKKMCLTVLPMLPTAYYKGEGHCCGLYGRLRACPD
jgi:copper oxidase (laccase) domain-containing protein